MSQNRETPGVTKILQSNEGKWKLLSDQLPDDGMDSEKPLSIITCVGDFGIGKSFLLNVILTYLKNNHEAFADETEIKYVFPVETTVESETKGIDMYNEYLSHPLLDEGVVALLDTEGPSDPTQSQDNATKVFALSAYFSSVLLYNMKEKFTTSNIDKLQVFLQDMRKLSDKNNEKHFQDLVIVIRDFSDEQFGYSWEGGKAYLDHMRNNETGLYGGGQIGTFFKELRHEFNSVLIFLMPPPNAAVAMKGRKIERMGDLDDNFCSCLFMLIQQIMYELLRPREFRDPQQILTVGEFRTELVKFAAKLENFKEPTSRTLANARKEEVVRRVLDECFKAYQDELQKNYGTFQSAETRRNKHEELKRATLEQFREGIEGHFVEENVVETFAKQLEELVDQRFDAFNDSSNKNQTALWVIGGVLVVGGAIALIVCYPSQAKMVWKTIRPFVQQAIPRVMPYLKDGITQILSPANTEMVGPCMAIACTLATELGPLPIRRR